MQLDCCLSHTQTHTHTDTHTHTHTYPDRLFHKLNDMQRESSKLRQELQESQERLETYQVYKYMCRCARVCLLCTTKMDCGLTFRDSNSLQLCAVHCLGSRTWCVALL
jgi:hypothetical protein